MLHRSLRNIERLVPPHALESFWQRPVQQSIALQVKRVYRR